MRASTRKLRELGNDFGHIRRQTHFESGHRKIARLLQGNRDFSCDRERIMGANLRTETILQWRNEPTAVCVVVGVGRREQQHIERKPKFEATDLHVALFKNVQQTDLDAFGKVGKFVNGENAAVGAGDETEVNGLFI